MCVWALEVFVLVVKVYGAALLNLLSFNHQELVMLMLLDDGGTNNQDIVVAGVRFPLM